MERQSSVATHNDRAARSFLLDQTIRYTYSRPVANVRQRLRVVPASAHDARGQGRWRLTVGGVPSSRTRTFLDRFGNVTVDVTVPRVDDAVEFGLEVEGPADPSGRHETVADRRYLRPARLTAADDAIIELASEAEAAEASGAGSPNVASLCARVHRSLDYEWGCTGVRTTASEALAGGRGVCQDYAHIMLAACRASGLVARYVSGHLTGEGGSHAWVEVLRPHPLRPNKWLAEGWDPTHNRRTNADYLVVAVGRDYADAAPMTGTYDGVGVTNTLVVEKHLHLI
jgi:transglutaminase-like putative cysteine protease